MKSFQYINHDGEQVEAHQLTLQNSAEAIALWCNGQVERESDRPEDPAHILLNERAKAYVGDWIVEVSTGKFFILTGAEFAAGYRYSTYAQELLGIGKLDDHSRASVLSHGLAAYVDQLHALSDEDREYIDEQLMYLAIGHLVAANALGQQIFKRMQRHM